MTPHVSADPTGGYGVVWVEPPDDDIVFAVPGVDGPLSFSGSNGLPPRVAHSGEGNAWSALVVWIGENGSWQQRRIRDDLTADEPSGPPFTGGELRHPNVVGSSQGGWIVSVIARNAGVNQLSFVELNAAGDKQGSAVTPVNEGLPIGPGSFSRQETQIVYGFSVDRSVNVASLTMPLNSVSYEPLLDAKRVRDDDSRVFVVARGGADLAVAFDTAEGVMVVSRGGISCAIETPLVGQSITGFAALGGDYIVLLQGSGPSGAALHVVRDCAIDPLPEQFGYANPPSLDMGDAFVTRGPLGYAFAWTQAGMNQRRAHVRVAGAPPCE